MCNTLAAMPLKTPCVFLCLALAMQAQTSFRGVYVGTVLAGGQGTSSVLLVNVLKNDTALGLLYDFVGKVFWEVPNVALDSEGRFAIRVANVTYTGRIQNGTIVATSSLGSLTVVGEKSPATGIAQAYAGMFPGWLVTPTTIRDHGWIITADGWIMTYARTGDTTSSGAVGRINAAGEFTLLFVGGDSATGRATPIAGTPTMTAFYQRGAVSYNMIGGRESAVNDLVNISTRGFVGVGSSVMIAGFVIEPRAKTVYLRAMGPTLAAFGVADALADPQLELYKGPALLMSNDDWQTSPSSVQIGARSDRPASPKEPALLVTLEPGAYTVILRGAANSTGNGLIEVNQVE